MKAISNSTVLAVMAFCGALTVVAAQPTKENVGSANSYHMFAKALNVDDSGVVAVPPRFKWSVETCVTGFDLQANPIPDSRVMLRLYDPDHNFTALTAQMDLATAENLQRKLAQVIAKKRENPAFELRPRLYDPSLLPTGRFKGNVDKDGVLQIEVNKNGVPLIELEQRVSDPTASDFAPPHAPFAAG